MFSYIKRHWPVYLILALIAIALGFGAAYVVGVKGSTPESAISGSVEKVGVRALAAPVSDIRNQLIS